ncbi:hypothetical protein HII31_04803 [Pseudocercospora fuligena]|uniref:Allergen n=1 Tax=Pseudocercospora fuligena TaxID=685502 RepID=A0A8H6RN82_9PEZI|nr:hypothetical protein HII31_04803 [Pseudocercospora fuligena]
MDAISNTSLGKIFKPSEPTETKTEQNGSTVPAKRKTETVEAEVAPAVQKETKVEQEVAPAVEHETVKREHETKDQTVVDREKHQHHYHTTVQPLEHQEVKPEKHDHEVAPTEYRDINKDQNGASVKAKVDQDQAAFKDKTEQGVTKETKTDEGKIVGEHVHHHLHETIQPVIEKETIKPSVTHKTIPVKEVIQEGSKNHGVTKNAAISVDEFQHRLDGEGKVLETTHDGKPTTSATTAVTDKQ